MRIGPLLGWGIVLYAVMYVVVAALAIYGISGVTARLISLCALIALATTAGLSLHARQAKDLVPYSLFWMLEVMLLDALMSAPFAGWQLYLDWNVWVGYALVALVPLFATLRSRAFDGSPQV